VNKPIKIESIAPMIHWIRHEKVILDRDLAALYGVETRALKQAVRRNADRFPGDFMFELLEEEVESMVSQNVIPHRGVFGGAAPMAFTEQGVAMLSSVLRSPQAVEVNIAKLFVSKYQLELPKKEEMQTFIDAQMREVTC